MEMKTVTRLGLPLPWKSKGVGYPSKSAMLLIARLIKKGLIFPGNKTFLYITATMLHINATNAIARLAQKQDGTVIMKVFVDWLSMFSCVEPLVSSDLATEEICPRKSINFCSLQCEMCATN